MLCLQCQKPVPFWRRMSRQRFCSKAHHDQYVDGHDRKAMEELTRRKQDLERSEKKPLPSPESTEPPTEPATPSPSAIDDPSAITETAAVPESAAIPESVADPNDIAQQTQEEVARFLTMVEIDRHFYQEILDRTPIGICVLGADSSVHYANASFRSACRGRFERAKDLRIGNLGLHKDLPTLVDTVRSTRASEKNVLLHGDAGHSIQALRVAVVPLNESDPDEVDEILLVVEDVSDVVRHTESAAVAAG